MASDEFCDVERRIRNHQGEMFHTQSGLPMTYEVDGSRTKVFRAKPWLLMEGARQIWAMDPTPP
jgi:hypothetical protein